MSKITLYYREGASDKVYQAAIEPKSDKFVVNFAYGRRGSMLSTGTKTPAPVDHARATAIFDKLVSSKTAKGYTVGPDGIPFNHSDKAGQVSGIRCQLLNPIDEAQVEDLIADSAWCMQEKMDGCRLLLKKAGATVTGINRKGLIIGLSEPIAESALRIPSDFIIDGECIGDAFIAFDLLSKTSEEAYRERLARLAELLRSGKHPHIELIETAFDTNSKAALLARLKADRKEGIVLKRLDAPYSPGRPASGGSQLKHKFYATGSFIVAGHNAQRSVSLRLHDRETSVGNVTVPSNHPVPPVGSIVEVRYLYIFENGCLYQPVYLQRRDDLEPADCTARQLKFRAQQFDEEENQQP